MDAQATMDAVRDYYGKTLKTNDDLKTSACCVAEAPPAHIRPVLGQIHDEIHTKFYGCGSPIPVALEGATVLDLGCGTGRDCYVLSKLVGPNGSVIGLDMTDEQLEVARRHRDFHAEAYGYSESNVDFRKGYIEDLASAGIEDASVDVVISNCVINLSPAKDRVLSEVFRVLKPGGELYFSDVFSGRRVPEPLTKDPVLVGECLSGALYIEDFRRLLRELGCADYRVLTSRPLEITEPEVERKIGMIDFYSMTIRGFKLDLEDICEDYGHVVTYRGNLEHCPHSYVLDDHHVFHTGLPVRVCGNTARMLSETRLAGYFELHGDFSTHFGPFQTDGAARQDTASQSATPPTACC